MTVPIAVTADFYAVRIHIGGVLHLHIDRSKLLGFHSWCDHFASYSIEYTLKGGSMVTEYTDRDKWTAVLKGLEEVL
jgi:hypothetical protein